jgi:hypothetical protein
LKKAKYLDPLTAKRVKTTREEIKMRELLKEAENAVAI